MVIIIIMIIIYFINIFFSVLHLKNSFKLFAGESDIICDQQEEIEEEIDRLEQQVSHLTPAA